jgi:hypothetical protein
MTYRNRFVAVVKADGGILREDAGVVRLPFGSEYSLLLKNLDGRRAVVDVHVDGESVIDNLVVAANSSSELAGFVKDGAVRDRFKFIRKTREVIDARGDRIDDGIVRINVRFEKDAVADADAGADADADSDAGAGTHTHHYHYYYHWGNYGPYWLQPCYPYIAPSITYCDNTTILCGGSGGGGSVGGSIIGNSVEFRAEAAVTPDANEGITIHGGTVYQPLTPVSVGRLESTSTVIILHLRGFDSGGIEVAEPVTVKDHIFCPACGKKSRPNANFCFACGAALKASEAHELV